MGSPTSRKSIRDALWGVVSAVFLGAFFLFFGIATKIPGPYSENEIASNPAEVLASSHGIPARDTLFFIISHKQHDVVTDEFVVARERLVSLLKDLRSESGAVAFSSIKTLGHSWARDSSFVSSDSKHLLIVCVTEDPIFATSNLAARVVGQVSDWKRDFADYGLTYGGASIVDYELFSLINKDLDNSLIYTVPITLLIVAWSFRSVCGTILTALVTGLSLVSSFGATAIVSSILGPISATASQLVVLLVMAVATDYALFFITRMRREVILCHSYPEAIRITKRTTGTAILWSGITVALSLSGLFLSKDSILTSMALVSIISVLITLAFCLKVLPAFIEIVGSKLEYGSLSFLSPRRHAHWKSWILWSSNNPMTALVSSLTVLILLGVFCIKLKLGSTMEPSMLPRTMQTSAAYQELAQFFPTSAGGDLSLVLYAKDLKEREDRGDLQEFFDIFQSNDAVSGPLSIDWSKDSTTARFRYSIAGGSSDSENARLFENLKQELIPSLLLEKGIEAKIAGKLEYDIRQQESYGSVTLTVIGAVLLLSTLLLLVAFESIVIAIKAILLNIVSTSAAFGLLVLSFQLFGWKYGVIESFVPALLFSILFGLSMDYHLFLLSSIREKVLGGADTRDAVQSTIAETYGVISSAATIMISVFLVISFLELPIMKQLGLGLAFAVFIDATLIRCVLLPSSMVLLGSYNWYAPKALVSTISLIKRSRGDD